MGNLLPPWATFVIVSDLQVVNDGTFNFQKRSVTHLEAHRGWCEGQAMLGGVVQGRAVQMLRAEGSAALFLAQRQELAR
jgi:hypothetical protein